MNKVNRKKQKDEKGFTMIELIIVVAIMGIIGAVLVPMFGNMSSKARLTSDVSTVKTLQRQIDIFKAEQGAFPTGFTSSTTASDVPSSVINDLVTKKYLDAKDLKVTGSNHSLKLQTAGTLKMINGRCYLAVGTSGTYADLLTTLDANDSNKDWAKAEATTAPPTTPAT